jgi:hypothetical protein
VGGMGMSLIGTVLALSPWAVLVALVSVESVELLRGFGARYVLSCWSRHTGPA